ncbi:hypothetical protein L1987_36810 [Smallanthus sonchifolius]|uniref:Uncharacterized protein n=1 Tax=Smallanthus sonchifolius TaxID=185202 RepID=A0ACB9HFA0_9ASTR|nr:hypothetical protein L1987_36810 [Smallanthus sonchifolius]
MLRSVLWFADSTPLCERPVRRIFTDVAGNLTCALSLVRKCRKPNPPIQLLDRSIGNIKWFLSIFDASNGGIILALPPIASNAVKIGGCCKIFGGGSGGLKWWHREKLISLGEVVAMPWLEVEVAVMARISFKMVVAV